jgi:hypothetical protein
MRLQWALVFDAATAGRRSRSAFDDPLDRPEWQGLAWIFEPWPRPAAWLRRWPVRAPSTSAGRPVTAARHGPVGRRGARARRGLAQPIGGT